jgi:hypothetical protein
MRFRSIILSLPALAVLATGAAHAAPARRPAADTPSSAGLRGPVSADGAGPAKAAPAPTLISAVPAPAANAQDRDQCRLACAHSYYFCLADPQAAACPETWIRCLSTCDRPPPPR